MVLLLTVSSKSICLDSKWSWLLLIRINSFLSFLVYLSKNRMMCSSCSFCYEFGDIIDCYVSSFLFHNSVNYILPFVRHCGGKRFMIFFKLSELSSFLMEPISFNVLAQFVSCVENLGSSTPSSGFTTVPLIKGFT